MSALETRKRQILKQTKRNTEESVIESTRSLFKVVVNNYKQKEIAPEDEIVETTMEEQQGLPPQPTGYLKYPTYDWF